MPLHTPSVIRTLIPLSLLLDHPEFGAELLSPPPDETENVAAVPEIGFALAIVIELVDPTPYLRPGDLLLITGLGLPKDPEEISEYVTRVKGAGAVALVFGVEPVYSAVPEPLIAACRAHSLPLIQLPPPVYFASIVSFVSRALEGERVRALASMVTTAQRLTESTIRPSPIQRLLGVLVRDCNGWAVLRSDQEMLIAGSPPEDIDLAELLTTFDQRLEPQLRQEGMPTSFATVTGDGVDYEVTAHSVRRPQQTRSTAAPPILMFGKAPRITSSDRTALLLTANLAGLIEQLPATQSTALDQLLMHFLIDATASMVSSRDHPRVTRLLSRALGQETESAHAVVATRLDERQPAVGDMEASWLRRLLHTPLVELRVQELRAFSAKPPSASDLDQAAEFGWVFSISRARPLAELPQAMYEAMELSRTARRLGRHIGGHDPEELSRVWPLAAITDPVLGNAAASLWLAALDGEECADEREALTMWLRRHGSWDRTARDLGLHRNTVRRLVQSAGKRLDRDLDDPVERARLLLAFSVTDPDQGA